MCFVEDLEELEIEGQGWTEGHQVAGQQAAGRGLAEADQGDPGETEEDKRNVPRNSEGISSELET